MRTVVLTVAEEGVHVLMVRPSAAHMLRFVFRVHVFHFRSASAERRLEEALAEY